MASPNVLSFLASEWSANHTTTVQYGLSHGNLGSRTRQVGRTGGDWFCYESGTSTSRGCGSANDLHALDLLFYWCLLKREIGFCPTELRKLIYPLLPHTWLCPRCFIYLVWLFVSTQRCLVFVGITECELRDHWNDTGNPIHKPNPNPYALILIRISGAVVSMQ